VAIKTLFVDPSRCIGCRACEAACRECDSHKGESMVMVDFVNRDVSVTTQPTVCMHCEDPLAPCAQVCPVMAILITPQRALPAIHLQQDGTMVYAIEEVSNE
jgi:Fe-S-cluster-containing dehydrogenase component